MADIGLLRHRLTWQQLSQPTTSTLGQPVDVWTSVGTYWGHVEPLAGMEAMNARQLIATSSHKITMRNIGAIAPSDRLMFESSGRIFDVDAVYRVDERNAYLTIHATELKNPQ